MDKFQFILRHMILYNLIIFTAWLILTETATLKTWEAESHENENIFIELSKNSGGYKISIDFLPLIRILIF